MNPIAVYLFYVKFLFLKPVSNILNENWIQAKTTV